MDSGATRVVAVDVGGTFTDVCVLDQASGDLDGRQGRLDRRSDRRRDGRGRAGRRRPLADRAVLPRHDGRDERADHAQAAEGGDGLHARLPRRGRDRPRHARRPVGRLQGQRRAVHPAPRPARGHRAGRPPRRGGHRRSTRTRRARWRGSWRGARSRRSRCASSTPTPTASTSSGWPRSCARRCPTRRSRRPPACCPSSSSTSASRPRSPTRSSRRWCRGYVCELDQRLKDDGYEGDLLILHSGGGVMTPEAVQELAVRLAASGIAAGAVAARYTAALCGHDNVIGVDMGGTSTDISLVYDGALRTTNEWFVEYGHPICFPSIEVLTIGAGGGSLAHDRRRRLAAQRPAVGGLATRARRPTARAARSRRTPTPTSSSGGSASGWSAAACRSTARPPRPRSARASPSRWASSCTRRPTRSSPSPTRTWPTRCGSSRCSAATTRASSRSSSSAAPGRCTAPRWPRSWACRRCSCRRARARGRRSAA